MKNKLRLTNLIQVSSLKELLLRFLHLTTETTDQRNAYYMVVEIFFSTFLNAAATFNAAYAIRLGASDAQISYLTSIPALIAILISIPAGNILQKTARKKNLIIGSLALHRAGYILVALVPWLQFLNISQSMLVVIFLIIFMVPIQFYNVGWTSLTAVLIKENQRTAVFSLRNQIYFTVNGISAFLFGLWLSAVAFPLNYQIMYLFTFGLSVISLIYLMKIEIPNTEDKPKSNQEKRTPKSIKKRVANTITELRANPQFLRFSINTFVMNFGLWAIAPFFTIFYVKELGASDAWLGILIAFNSVANIIGFGLWRKLIQKYGRKKILMFTSLLRPIYPIIVALSQNLPAIIIVSAVTGLLMPGLNLSHYNLLLTITPGDRRDEFTAYYTTFQNISVFLSPLLGALVILWVGYPITFLIFAGVRLLGGLMWRILPIKDFDQQPAKPL